MNNENNEQLIADQLLDILRQFLLELDAERALHSITLNASLESDLGIDSIGKVELFTRIEKAFSVHLPERAIVEVNSLNDIIKLLGESTSDLPKKIAQEFVPTLEITTLDLNAAQTLLEVLFAHAANDPKRPHLYLQNEAGEEEVIEYGQLLEEARNIARGLYNKGIQQGETVAIMLPTCKEFFYVFCGILLAGAIPVPIYPPFRPDQIEEYAEREAKILHDAQVRILITFTQAELLSQVLRTFVPSLKEVTTVQKIRLQTGMLPNIDIESHSPILIQYTSGSTGDPKGVLLTHQNMLSNIRAIGKSIPVSPKDVGVSWLPLYHDMGLMNWLGSMYFGIPMVILSPLTFLTRPEQWLWAIHFHRATLSGAPNFAYELCIKKINDNDIKGLDLHSWRFAFNGAEAVNPKTLDNFAKKFAPYGFDIESFAPVYGLAESTVGLTFPHKRRKPHIDRIEREVFEKENKAIPSTKNHSIRNHSIKFVSCGSPLPNHDIRIVDEDGNEIGDRQVGAVQFTGPSSMQGYFNKPNATKEVYHKGWWDTGDLGYMVKKELFITGRKKDLIIKAGRNLYPEGIEEIVSQIPHIRKGCVVAFGISDQLSGTEKLIVVAETYELKKAKQQLMITEINKKMTIELGIQPDTVLLVPPKTVLKTSSGKLRRSTCKQAYIEGTLIRNRRSVKWQFMTLFLRSLYRKAHDWLFLAGKLLYTIYMVFVVVIVVFPAWFCALFLSKSIAMKASHMSARYIFKLGMCSIHLDGKENLTTQAPMVFVCNHASYLDALLLIAVLPPGVLFTAKSELSKAPIIRTFVNNLGYLIVERMHFTKSIENEKQIEKAIQDKNSVLIFPEGTFTYARGLRPFKLGAFNIAVETKTPLCPISLSGTRSFLRDGSYLLNPGKLKVTIGKPIYPKDDGWDEVIRLHNLARSEINKYCGEPAIDLIVAGFEG